MMYGAIPIKFLGVGMHASERFVARSRVLRIHNAGSICVLDYGVARGVDGQRMFGIRGKYSSGAKGPASTLPSLLKALEFH